MSFANLRLSKWSGMFCGHTREHSPQSTQRPATCHARMMWYMFSSKESAATFCEAPDFGLSKMQCSHVQAGHTSRQALHLMQRESSFCQNAKRSSLDMASIFSTMSKRPSFSPKERAVAFDSSSQQRSSSYVMCILFLHTVQRSAICFACSAVLLSVTDSYMPLQGMPIAYTSSRLIRCSFRSSVKL